ncbi:MAG: prolipoprotein diacylglyceryl transferase [Christensenellales bacterium]
MHWTGKVTPIAFSIGNFSVAWYGIIITCAMVLALVISIKRVKRINVSADDMLMLFLIAIPLAVIFARLGYVISNYKVYFTSPYDWDAFVNTIAIWKGGLTIMWGVPGGCLGAFIWAKIYKKDVIKVADIVLPTVLLAQAIGRWGNFFNQELYGQPVTDPNAQWFPLAVFIEHEGEWRQATFFYEMVLNLIGFIVLSCLVRRIDVKGFGSLAYFGWYCAVRGIMEIFRAETSVIDDKLGFNSVMVLCFVVAALCVAGIVLLILRKKKRGGKVFFKNGIPPLPPEKKASDETLTLN